MGDLISRLHTQENFDLKEFKKTDTLLQPAYTWIWNAPIVKEEVERQLDAMVEAGIRTVYILPEPQNFRPYNERIYMTPDYLTDEFFAELRYAMEYALKKGMSCWMYDEGGWPSGSACGRVTKGHPELCRKSIAVREVCLKSGESYTPGEHVISAFMPGEVGKQTMVVPGETMESDVVLTEYYAQWHGGMIVDSLDEDVGRVFVNSTHELYAKFLGDLFGEKNEDGGWIEGSSKLQMMFTDEPGAGRYAWPRNFEKKFREKYGYNVEPYVPVLLNDSEDVDAAGTQARIDYRELAGEMFRDNYFAPIHEWCRRNNVLATGHLDIDHQSDGCMYHNYGSVLSQLREMDVPGIDVIWRQITEPVGGKSPCDEGNGFFPRFAASAAAQSGGKYAVSESFAVYGASLSGEETRFVLNHQLVRGINIFNVMSMSYGKVSAVPTVMRPAFISEMPGYNNLRAINDYTARACYLMQLGSSGVRSALYLPNRDIWTAGTRRARAVTAFDALGQQLEARQVEFDIIDDEGIRMARRVGDELHIGAARYRYILAPECEFMPEDVREIIESMDHDIVPAVQCDCPALRVRTRIMPDGGTLWMLFNESDQEQKVNLVLPGSGSMYRLDVENARVEKAPTSLEGLVLRAGEAQFYLCSSEPLEEAQEMLTDREIIAEIGGFSIRMSRSSWLDAQGIHDRRHSEPSAACELGAWTGIFGHEFSGEAVYSATVRLVKPLEAGKIYELDLGRVECSANVRIDGQKVGIAWANPKRIMFDGAVACGKTEFGLEIEVANTLSNQFNTQPQEEMYLAADRGPYQKQLKRFEEDAPLGGLYGPVVLSCLM